jgi:AGCS family alanine or glycine:cation symporter
MSGPVIDELIICTLNALAILGTGVWETTSDNGVSLTTKYSILSLLIMAFIY